MSKFKEGDVFSWRYKRPDVEAQRSGTEYWCKSRIARFKDGFLGDTYWGNDDLRAIREDDVDLTFLGNVEDYEHLSDYNVMFYDKADILDLRHANDTRLPLLLKKGAKRSQPATIEYCRYKIERAASEIRSAQNQIDRLEKAIADVEAGKIDEVWL